MGNNLKHYRKENGLSQVAVAKTVRISERYYQDLERGISIPNIYIAQRIAKSLQTEIEKVFPDYQESGCSDVGASKQPKE